MAASLIKFNDDVKNGWIKKIIAVEDATYAQTCLAFFQAFKTV